MRTKTHLLGLPLLLSSIFACTLAQGDSLTNIIETQEAKAAAAKNAVAKEQIERLPPTPEELVAVKQLLELINQWFHGLKQVQTTKQADKLAAVLIETVPNITRALDIIRARPGARIVLLESCQIQLLDGSDSITKEVKRLLESELMTPSLQQAIDGFKQLRTSDKAVRTAASTVTNQDATQPQQKPASPAGNTTSKEGTTTQPKQPTVSALPGRTTRTVESILSDIMSVTMLIYSIEQDDNIEPFARKTTMIAGRLSVWANELDKMGNQLPTIKKEYADRFKTANESLSRARNIIDTHLQYSPKIDEAFTLFESFVPSFIKEASKPTPPPQ